MAARSKEMEQTQEQQQEEIQALLEQLEDLKQQSEEDKETAGEGDLSWQRPFLQLRAGVPATPKRQLEVEITVLKNQVTEMTAQIHTVEEKGRAETEGLLDRLHRLTSDNSVNKLVNLTQSQSEAQQLKSSVKKLESQVENYKSKVQRARLESEEYCLKLEISEKDAQEMKADLESDIVQLREAQEETHTQERRNTEQHNTPTELRHKVEQQGCLVETFQEKNVLLLEGNTILKHKMESIERWRDDSGIS
ncbi:hypothetical protein J4Q44_G00234710 [Coregonus suidteri]|uniref:Outer dense fiber protein 2 n=1 Tax=Coregonus suidteri TaxID=861788 RepID=A0AAN8QNV4_9TELE